MHLTPGLHRVDLHDVEAARGRASEAGYATFVLPGDAIVDREAFFAAIRATLPLDPPVVSSHVWDALADSIWQGLSDHPAARIAILWPHSRVKAVRAPLDFEIALGVFEQVVHELSDLTATVGPKDVAVLVG
jgi:hypothetical protein